MGVACPPGRSKGNVMKTRLNPKKAIQPRMNTDEHGFPCWESFHECLSVFMRGFIALFIFATPIFSAEELPVTRVVLFTSGVGFLQREGEVTGNASVELSFRTEQINDLLKSLVLQDLG